jgi:hypothetical protein
MKEFSRKTAAITNGIFGAAVVALIIVAAIGFGLYGFAASKAPATTTLTLTTTNVSTEMITSSETMLNHSTNSSMIEPMGNSSSSGCACMFTPKSGAMISSAWLVVAPTGMTHQFAVSVHAQGLEPNGTYIVEGQLMTGGVATVPISSLSMHMNSTSTSEFQADKNGTGNYFILLDSNPSTAFENVELLFLPGMVMQNATLVASVNLASMMASSTTSH